jgi:hypothetical protein
VGARFELGRFALSTFQASLTDDWRRRRFAGHRLTTALPRGVFLGISETVVYQGDVKHMYIVPLGIFYAQQFNEGSNVDNILWELDWKVPLRRGLLFYGELLIDDFQYQRDENSGPDRLGLHVAADALFMVGGRELELSAGYTHIDTYTYAHFMAGGYVAGDGNAQMNPLLGSSLGPDADRRFIKATLGMSARAAVSVEGAYSMYGSNNQLFNAYLQDWAPSMDNDPAFPTAPVLRVKYVLAGLLYDLNRGSYISVAGGMKFSDGGPDNVDAEEGFGWLGVVLDL